MSERRTDEDSRCWNAFDVCRLTTRVQDILTHARFQTIDPSLSCLNRLTHTHAKQDANAEASCSCGQIASACTTKRPLVGAEAFT